MLNYIGSRSDKNYIQMRKNQMADLKKRSKKPVGIEERKSELKSKLSKINEVR